MYFRFFFISDVETYIYTSKSRLRLEFIRIAFDLQSLPPSLWSLQKSYETVEIKLISVSAIVAGATIAIISGSVCECFGTDHMKTSHYQPIFFLSIDSQLSAKSASHKFKKVKRRSVIWSRNEKMKHVKWVRYLLYLKMIDIRQKKESIAYCYLVVLRVNK